MRNFSPDWGRSQNEEDSIVEAAIGNDIIAEKVDITTLLAVQSDNKNAVIDFSNEMDGSIKGFGKRFWKQVEKSDCAIKPIIDNEIEVTKIRYTDRYLMSPQTVVMLIKVISEMPFKSSIDTNLFISSAVDKPNYRNDQNLMKDNWINKETQESVMKEFASKILDINVKVSITKQGYELPHYRKLEIEFSNGQLFTLFLDQGFGFWGAEKFFHDFNYNYIYQSEELIKFSNSEARVFCYGRSGKLAKSYMAVSIV
jgi:hypothetical protein